MNISPFGLHYRDLEKDSISRSELVIGKENLEAIIFGLQKADDGPQTKKSLLFITQFISEPIRFKYIMKHIAEHYGDTAHSTDAFRLGANLTELENDWEKHCKIFLRGILEERNTKESMPEEIFDRINVILEIDGVDFEEIGIELEPSSSNPHKHSSSRKQKKKMEKQMKKLAKQNRKHKREGKEEEEEEENEENRKKVTVARTAKSLKTLGVDR